MPALNETRTVTCVGPYYRSYADDFASLAERTDDYSEYVEGALVDVEATATIELDSDEVVWVVTLVRVPVA